MAIRMPGSLLPALVASFPQALKRLAYNRSDDSESQRDDADGILGSVRMAAGSFTLIGHKTRFLTDLKVGQAISIDDHQHVIQSIENDTCLLLYPAAQRDYVGWIDLIHVGSYSISMGSVAASGYRPAAMGVVTRNRTNSIPKNCFRD